MKQNSLKKSVGRSLIVIVNYNGERLLAPCLKSLEPELTESDDVLVVDNGSSDESVTLLSKQFPWAKQLNLSENTGFSGGNNAALKFVNDYEYFILLNNDIEVEPGFLESLLKVAAEPKVGIANSVILDAAGQKIDHAGGKWLVFLSGTNVGAYRGKDPSILPKKPFETTYASGASFAIPTKLVRKFGLFPDFFAYYEDLDISWKIKRAGYKIFVVPDSRVRHLGSATSSKQRPRFERYAARNRIYLFRRNLSWWQKPIVLPILVLLRLLLFMPVIRKPEILRAQVAGLWDGLTTKVPA